MTKILFFFWLCFAFSFSSIGQGIPFVKLSWEETVALAQKEKKPIFVDAYAVWCGPCKKMDQLTFSHQAVTKMFSEKFISFKIDMEKGEGPRLKKLFGVSAYPTLLWFNPEQEILLKVTGFQEANTFMGLARTALEKYNPYLDMETSFQEGNRDPSFVLEFIQSLSESQKSVKEIAREYFKNNPLKQLTEIDKKIVFYSVEEADSKYFDFLLLNISWYQSFFGLTVLEEKIEKACFKTVDKAYEYQYEGLMEEAKALYRKALPSKGDLFEKRADFRFALLSKDKAKVLIAAESLISSEYADNREKLLLMDAQIGQYIESDSEDIYLLRLKILLRAEELKKDAEIYLQLAKIYLQKNEKERALEALEKVLEFSKEGETIYAQAQKKLLELRSF